MHTRLSPADVSAVVCTLNSVTGIERCLLSLRQAGVGELIVVDAASTDGTRAIADRLADLVLEDPGTGLGNARNIGIACTTKPLILNMGSDNVMPPGQLAYMISALENGGFQGVSARTTIPGGSYLARGLNAWRAGRFIPGPAAVIGTPTLFDGALLRAHPYDASRRFSDDSELCERWAREHGARFAISEAIVEEIGKTSWDEVRVRCRMYGISDEEVYRAGVASGWGLCRRLISIGHPLRVDLLQPASRIPMRQAVSALPFLAAFTVMRYAAWAKSSTRRRCT